MVRKLTDPSQEWARFLKFQKEVLGGELKQPILQQTRGRPEHIVRVLSGKLTAGTLSHAGLRLAGCAATCSHKEGVVEERCQ